MSLRSLSETVPLAYTQSDFAVPIWNVDERLGLANGNW